MRNPNLLASEQRKIDGQPAERDQVRKRHGLWLLKFAGVALFALLTVSIGESLAWNGAFGYPGVLVTNAPSGDLERQRATCGSPLEVHAVDGGSALVRCGMFWPLARVWKTKRETVDPFRRPSVQ